jgi:hypothetical protein
MERINLRRLPADSTADEEVLLQAIDDATATPVYIEYRLADEPCSQRRTRFNSRKASTSSRPWPSKAFARAGETHDQALRTDVPFVRHSFLSILSVLSRY